jgi:hypothetical protein
MAIHVTRPDGSVAGFEDDKRDVAEAYAKDVNGEVSDVSDTDGEQAPQSQEVPND